MTTKVDTSKFAKVGQDIVEFVTTSPKRGRRGSPAIPAGTKLYAIKYSKGGYFTYSYMSRRDAEMSITNSQIQGTDNEFYYPWNVVRDIQATMHVAPRTK